jgi:pullulanase/glycogen debranching enzyme
MLFNYIGAIVIKSGTEGATTKHKDYNSFRSEDVNLIDWYRMEKYSDMVDYFSSYIKFRISHPAYVMSRQDVINKFETLDSHRGYIKGKMFKDYANGDPFDKLLIYHNLSNSDLEVVLPTQKGNWAVVCNDMTAGNIRIGSPVSGTIIVPNLTTIVLGDNNSVEKIMLSNNDPLSYLSLKNIK